VFERNEVDYRRNRRGWVEGIELIANMVTDVNVVVMPWDKEAKIPVGD
jgi:hypothetical protein